MLIHQRSVGEWTVLGLEGKIDHMAAPQLQTTMMGLVESGKRALILDCGQLTYLSSAGLRVLLVAAQQQRERRLAIKLCHLNPNIRQFFEMSGLLQWIPVVPTAFDATQEPPPRHL
jgi:anti-anti-sigma factor